MPNTIEFFVDNFSAQNDVYHVAGVCNSGSILIGSIFTQVIQNIMGRDADGFPIPLGKEFIRNIELKVQKIRTYNVYIDELPQGMTGELWLGGEEGLQIQPKRTLTN